MKAVFPIILFSLLPSLAMAQTVCELHPTPSTALDPKIDEISGLARTTTQESILWAHTDSGGKAELYAVNYNGEIQAIATIQNAKNIDWEDIANGPCSPTELNRSCIYIADLGDNLFNRHDKKIYVVENPSPDYKKQNLPVKLNLKVLRTIPVAFKPTSENQEAKFANPDCESIMVDPRDASIYIITKQSSGGEQTLYRVEENQKKGAPAILHNLGSATYTSFAGAFKPIFNATTGADFSPDGTHFAIRTYAKIYEYDVTNKTVEEAFKSPSAEYTAIEGQGESIVYANDEQPHHKFITASEKIDNVTNSALLFKYKYECKDISESPTSNE